MKKPFVLFLFLSFFLFSGFQVLTFSGSAPGSEEQNPKPGDLGQKPATKMAEGMLQRLAHYLQVKNIVGDPLKIGEMTVIPIIMIDLGYGGGGGGLIQGKTAAEGFYMSGEARPLGFIIISKSGVKFLNAGLAPRK